MTNPISQTAHLVSSRNTPGMVTEPKGPDENILSNMVMGEIPLEPPLHPSHTGITVLNEAISRGYEPFYYLPSTGKLHGEDARRLLQDAFPGHDYLVLQKGQECLFIDRGAGLVKWHAREEDFLKCSDLSLHDIATICLTPHKPENHRLITEANVASVSALGAILENPALLKCCAKKFDAWLNFDSTKTTNEREALATKFTELAPYFDSAFSRSGFLGYSRIAQDYLMDRVRDQTIRLNAPLREPFLSLIQNITHLRVDSKNQPSEFFDLVLQAAQNRHLANLTSLSVKVDLQFNPVTHWGIHLSHLENLELTGNVSERTLAQVAYALPHLPRLRVASAACVALSHFPSSLKELEVDSCPQMLELAGIPPSLEKLTIKRTPNVRITDPLPSSLRTLKLQNCQKLKRLMELPEGLTTLTLSSCKNLQAIAHLPTALVTLFIDESKNLRGLPALPHPLKTLRITFCENLSTLPVLNARLKHLCVWGNPRFRPPQVFPDSLESLALSTDKLTRLEKLPSTMKSLLLNGCPNLVEIVTIPHGIIEFMCQEAHHLKTLPHLPSTLSLLDCTFCSRLKTIPNFPENLTYLFLDECGSLRTLPCDLPPKLRWLSAVNLSKRVDLPALPPTLKVFRFSGTPIPDFPIGLENLHLKDVHGPSIGVLPRTLQTLTLLNLTGPLPIMPGNLRELSLERAKDLTKIETLPGNLKHLEIKNLKELQSYGELPPRLESLAVIRCPNAKCVGGHPATLTHWEYSVGKQDRCC